MGIYRENLFSELLTYIYESCRNGQTLQPPVNHHVVSLNNPHHISEPDNSSRPCFFFRNVCVVLNICAFLSLSTLVIHAGPLPQDVIGAPFSEMMNKVETTDMVETMTLQVVTVATRASATSATLAYSPTMGR